MTTNNYFVLVTRNNRIADHVFFSDQAASTTQLAKHRAEELASELENVLGKKPRIVVWSKRRWPDLLAAYKEVGEANKISLVEDEE